MEKVCTWCKERYVIPNKLECAICYYLPGHEGASDLVQIPASELASLQAENERYRAFVEEVAAFAQGSDVFRVKSELLISGDRLAEKATALLASMKPAEENE